MSTRPRAARPAAAWAAGASVARGLRRIVDALQRGLFDDVAGLEPDSFLPDAGRAAPPPASHRDASPAVEPDHAPSVLRHPRASRELVLGGQCVAFLLRRSRRRSIGFVVGLDGLSVSAPKWVGLREIDAAVRERSDWILARLAEQRERAARVEAQRIVWKDGAELPYLGQPIRVALDAGKGLRDGQVALDAATDGDGGAPRTLRVALPRDASPERLRDAVQSWLQREAKALFERRAAHFAEQLGVRVTRLSLSSAQTRWGSANASGAVRLHWRLIHFPIATIDYVVAHELAHLREMNHSARFWDVVRSVVPGYQTAKAHLSREALASWD